jgi:glucose/arabinose dehydrogenase
MKASILSHMAAAILLAGCANHEGIRSQVNTDSALSATETPAQEAPAAPVATPFSKEAVYEQIRFTVTSPGQATGNSFTVTPTGLSASNEPFTQDIAGLVADIETGDIDGDNAPELLVKTKSGADEKGVAYVFSSNRNKSLSMVNLPDFSSDTKLAAGYQGHDEYALVESVFMIRFPLYEGGQKTGKMRQLQYKLKPGEAMKQLVLDKTTEY